MNIATITSIMDTMATTSILPECVLVGYRQATLPAGFWHHATQNDVSLAHSNGILADGDIGTYLHNGQAAFIFLQFSRHTL